MRPTSEIMKDILSQQYLIRSQYGDDGKCRVHLHPLAIQELVRRMQAEDPWSERIGRPSDPALLVSRIAGLEVCEDETMEIGEVRVVYSETAMEFAHRMRSAEMRLMLSQPPLPVPTVKALIRHWLRKPRKGARPR